MGLGLWLYLGQDLEDELSLSNFFFCMKNKENWCAHCIIDEWVNLAKSRLKLTFNGGLLFPRLDYDGTVKLGKQWKAAMNCQICWKEI